MANNPYEEAYQDDPGFENPDTFATQHAQSRENRQRVRTVARNANQMVQAATVPTSVAGMFDFGRIYKQAATPDLTPLNPSDAVDPAGFGAQVETAFLEARGEVPFPWLMAQDPDDLRLLRPDISEKIFQMQEDAAYAAASDARIQEEIQRTVDGQARLRSLGRLALQGPGALGMSNEGLVTPEERAEIEKEVRDRILGTGEVPEEVRHWSDAFFGVAGLLFGGKKTVETGMNWFGQGMNLVIRGLVGQADPGGSTGAALYGINAFGIRDRAEADAQRELEELEAEQALTPQDIMDRLRPMAAEQAWQQLQNTEPEEHQQWLAMGGDPFTAFALFAGALAEDPAVQQQLAGIVTNPETGYHKDLEEFTDTLDENDYRLSDTVLDGMAFYGKYPMRLATAATLLLTDEDVRSETVAGRWSNLWEETAKYDDSPAAVLGLEGTAVGLLLDLGAGIAFDPTTWLFGPRGTAMLRRASTKLGVERVLQSRLMRRARTDAVRIAYSDAHGLSAQVMNSQWLEEVGLMGEALDILGGVDKTLPARPYLHLDERALYTRETAIGSVSRMLDPADLERMAALPQQTVDNLTTSVRNNGFQSAIEATYSVRDGTLHITDGIKRLRAAQEMNLRGVPLTIRMTDSLRSVRVPPARAALITEVANTPDNFVFSGSNRMKQTDVDSLLSGETQLAEGTGLARRQGRAEEFSQGRDGPLQFPQAADAEDWVVAYRRTDLTPEMQTRLATGDIEELAGAMPKPVLAYRPSEGMAGAPTGPAGVPLRDLTDVPRGLPESMEGLEANVGANTYVTPDQIFPREFTLGRDAVTAEAALDKIYRRAMMDGATPPSANRLATASGWNDKIRQAAKNNKGVDWVRRYMSPQHTINRFELRGPLAVPKITETTVRLWGSDQAAVDLYLHRIYDYQRRVVSNTSKYMDEMARLQPELIELKALQDLHGGGWDDSMRFLDEQASPELAQARANQMQVTEEVFARTQTMNRRMAEADARMAAAVPDVAELGKIVEDMWDDFNRKKIAPRWADEVNPLTKKKDFVNPETGLVDWETLRRVRYQGEPIAALGDAPPRHFIPEDMAVEARGMGINAEALVSELSEVNKLKMAVNVPLTPLDMIMASEWGGAKWTRYSHQQFVGRMRELTYSVNKMWVLDKVTSPATASRVSFDELSRIFHTQGEKGVLEWMQRRTDLVAARATAVLRHGRNDVRAGAQHLPRATQERIRVLQDYPTQLNQAERQIYDNSGVAWDDIQPDDPIYMDAARRWTGDLLQDSGFRAYLRGEAAFREYFMSPDGLRLRQATVMKKGTTTLLNDWHELYTGYQTLFERVMLKPATTKGTFAETRQAFRDTAAQIDAAGGRPHDLPQSTFDNLGSVRGVRKAGTGQRLIDQVSEPFMDNFMMNPVNFRRGLLADMVRTTELKRLRSLFADQGRRVVSNIELEAALDMHGMSGMRTGLQNHFDELAMRNGMVTESWINNLAEGRVATEIDNLLYTWDQGSRMGQASKAVFPFGRPWADMMGFWGREMLSRPALRGHINDANFLNIGKIANFAVDRLPFNPKPAALASRLAATDFSMDQPFGEGGPSMDLGSILFMPTGGNNPFGAILPGLGYAPMWLLDQFLEHAHDPVTDALAYQNLVEEVSQIIPGAAYTTHGGLGSVVGGGTVGTGVSLAVDLIGAQTNKPYIPVEQQFLGDITREINRGREVGLLLSDPEELAALLSLQDPEVIELHLLGLITEANNRASLTHAGETIGRYLTPTRPQFGTAVEEIQDVWLDAAQQFPADLRPTNSYSNPTPEEKRQMADDVRGQFFDLPQWKRDLFIAHNPALAINLIASWEWSPLGTSAVGAEGLSAYRYGGGSTQESAARHQMLLDQGYIRPIEPYKRAQLILGLMQSSRDSSAKRIYEFTAQSINEVLWTQRVQPGTQQILENVANSAFGTEYGYTTAREVWQNWGTAEGQLEDWMATDQGVAQGTEEFEALRAAVTIPTKERAWGASWPGLNEEGVSQRFQDITINEFTPEVTQLAAELGIELTPGMTGLQLFTGVQEEITAVDTPLFDMVRPAYDEYSQGRNAVARTQRDTLRKRTRNPNLAPEYREVADQFFSYVDLLEHRLSEGQEQPRPTLAEQEEVARRFTILRDTGAINTDWEGIWEGGYARKYGPLDWVMPTPPGPVLEDGTANPNAYKPYVQRIVDGDSLVVSTSFGPPTLTPGVNARNAQPRVHEVRLLGINAAEWNAEDGTAATKRLEDALMEGLRNGDSIYLVRDPATFGTNTDAYGRELAWLFIGDQPYMDEATLRRQEVPSGDLELPSNTVEE